VGTQGTVEHAAYALRTLKAALARPSGAFECPIEIDVDLFFWLEATRRLVRGDAFGFYWMEEPTPRLIVSVGEQGHATLLALGDASREHAQIWPLRTQRPAALDAAAKAVGPLLSSIRDASLETLLDRIAKAGEL
jgi:type VI secretion system protein ImpM